MVVDALGQMADSSGEEQRRRGAGQAEAAGDRVAGEFPLRRLAQRLRDLL